MGWFGKDPKQTSKEQVREWNSKLRKQQMLLDRQIRAIQREEDKVKSELKKAAKRNDKDVCLVFAKEIVSSRKAVARLQTSKAHLNSIMMNMTQQLATLRVANSLERSTDVMRAMQNVIHVTEISGVMQDLAREMMKAGIIDEMLEETMENAVGDSDELEEEAAEEVDKVLFEITNGALGKAPAVVSDSLPAESVKAEPKKSEEDEEDIDKMRQRLEALRN
ncbi:Charged multivesicular body protein 3 [Sarcoptes scabiei]|uniref:Charged multivesicular body protein 3 n=1 Tax=Sarcoptes scabiei TaxID=52283 RepID=A0A834R3P6_SARSC|nr:Charged multivesicular body protein 3 [Sarcoptes scabiei]UXI20262.1 tartan protein [Sarcoptes scabiei]